MKDTKIEVAEYAEEFQLCFSAGWKSAIGHRITVGDFDFSAVPSDGNIIISEVSSGSEVFKLPLPSEINDYPAFISFLKISVASLIFTMIKKTGKEILRRKISKSRNKNIQKYGKQPPITRIYTNWLTEEVSDMLH